MRAFNGRFLKVLGDQTFLDILREPLEPEQLAEKMRAAGFEVVLTPIEALGWSGFT